MYSGTEVAVLLGDGAVVGGGEGGVGGEHGELSLVYDVAQVAVGGVCLEVVLDGDDGSGPIRLVVGDELGELLLQKFVFGLEARYEIEDLFQDFAEGQATVNRRGLSQLVEGVVVLGLVEDLPVYVVNDEVPVAGFHSVLYDVVRPNGVGEAVEQHTVYLHALVLQWSLP